MWILDGAWGMHDGGMGWWIFGAVWMFVFWGLVIGLVVWAVGRLTGQRESDRGGPRGEPSAIEIARTRYARGEITREEFEQLRQDLA